MADNINGYTNYYNGEGSYKVVGKSGIYLKQDIQSFMNSSSYSYKEFVDLWPMGGDLNLSGRSFPWPPICTYTGTWINKVTITTDLNEEILEPSNIQERVDLSSASCSESIKAQGFLHLNFVLS